MNSNETMDGVIGIEKFEVVSPQDNVGDYFDYENFYPADGDHSPFIGDWVRRTFTTKEGRERRARRRSDRTQRRDLRSKAKMVDARAREVAAKGLSDKSGDIALARAMATQDRRPAPSTDTEDKGMSTTTMILIGVGALALIGVVYMAMRKNKKNG